MASKQHEQVVTRTLKTNGQHYGRQGAAQSRRGNKEDRKSAVTTRWPNYIRANNYQVRQVRRHRDGGDDSM